MWLPCSDGGNIDSVLIILELNDLDRPLKHENLVLTLNDILCAP